MRASVRLLPASAAVAAFRERHADDVDFHRWLQWLLEQQLATAQQDAVRARAALTGADPGQLEEQLAEDAARDDHGDGLARFKLVFIMAQNAVLHG